MMMEPLFPNSDDFIMSVENSFAGFLFCFSEGFAVGMTVDVIT